MTAGHNALRGLGPGNYRISAGPRHRWVFGSLYRLPAQPPKIGAAAGVAEPVLDSE
jgi:hypothetical protein